MALKFKIMVVTLPFSLLQSISSLCPSVVICFSLDRVPAVSALLFRDGLTMGLGTSTGHVSEILNRIKCNLT